MSKAAEICMRGNDLCLQAGQLSMMAKNFDREITVMPWFDRKDKTFLSSAMSLSSVMRYLAFPLTAVSIMTLSSGSRHIWRSPFKVTLSAMTAIESSISAISRMLKRYPTKNFSRWKTSASSVSCCCEITSLKRSFRHASTRPPAVLEEAITADTQTLVSATTFTHASFCPDLFNGFFYIPLYFFLSKLRCLATNRFQGFIESLFPIIVRQYLNTHFLMFFHTNFFSGLKTPFS